MCYARDTLNNGKCLACPSGCLYCEKSDTCKICNHGYVLKNGLCESCPYPCDACELNSQNEIICTQCYYYHYVLNPEKHCIDCKDLTGEGLVGCER